MKQGFMILASEDDGDDNGMSRYMENDDEEGWEQGAIDEWIMENGKWRMDNG